MGSIHTTLYFDEATNTATWLLVNSASNECVIIDPVLDFDAASGTVTTSSADVLIETIRKQDLSLSYVLETHVHADHMTGAAYLKERLGAEIVIGAGVLEVQKTFAPIFGLSDLALDGSSFDRLVRDGDTLPFGDETITVMATPGHTPACVCYLVGDAVFVGDTLFMPDSGSARADFPGGDAGELYDSIQKILALPDATRMHLCHDYKGGGREEFCCETSILEQRKNNTHVGGGTSRDDYIATREARDQNLKFPALLLPAIQVNLDAGCLPAPDSDGRRYLKIPLDAF
ncbi:MAG: MBL fold metallo-hydrolase [Pseudomonadota bacterium]